MNAVIKLPTPKALPSKSHLILGSGYLGSDSRVLNVINQVVKKYQAELIHTGPLIRRKEYNKVRQNPKGFTSIFSKEMEVIRSIAKHFSKIKFILPSMSTIHFVNDLTKDIRDIEDEEDKIEAFAEILKDMWYPNKEDLSDEALEELNKEAVYILENMTVPKNVQIEKKYYYLLTEHLGVSTVQPKHEINTRVAPSMRLMDEYRKYASNWILPFPVPEVDAKEKLGLNKSNNYWYTGCLYIPDALDGFDQYHKTDHLPAAVFVVTNPSNGEFDARHIHIETTGSELFAVDDGYAFTTKACIDLDIDRAAGSTDDHVPYTHPGTLAAARAINVLHKPKEYINIGDAGEMEGVHRHNHKDGNREELEGKRLINDFISIRGLVDAHMKGFDSIKKYVMIESNHLNWVDIHAKSFPEYKGLVDLQSLVNRFFSDVYWMIHKGGENLAYYWNDILVRHGHQEDIRKGGRIAKYFKYLCGHYHSRKKFKRAQQVGCGAGLGPSFHGNRASAQQSSVFTMTAWKGIGSVADKYVLHDEKRKVSRFVYRNTFYEVPWCIIKGVTLYAD